MDFDIILYVEYLSHNNNYKNEIILFLKGGWVTKGALMYTLFMLIHELLNRGLNSLVLMTATFFEDSHGYTLSPLIYTCMKISKYIFSDSLKFEKPQTEL